MKMKRTVKAAIAASMAVAVFGVGAVSFAAWQGSAVSGLPVTGNFGSVEISTYGFDVGEATVWNNGTAENGMGKYFMDGIVPYDQTQDDGTSYKTMAHIDLPKILFGTGDDALDMDDLCIYLTYDTGKVSGTFYYQIYWVDPMTEDDDAEELARPGLPQKPAENDSWTIENDTNWVSGNGDGISLGTLPDGATIDEDGCLSGVYIAVIYSSDMKGDETGFDLTITVDKAGPTTPPPVVEEGGEG